MEAARKAALNNAKKKVDDGQKKHNQMKTKSMAQKRRENR